jgi:hypothetical protein
MQETLDTGHPDKRLIYLKNLERARRIERPTLTLAGFACDVSVPIVLKTLMGAIFDTFTFVIEPSHPSDLRKNIALIALDFGADRSVYRTAICGSNPMRFGADPRRERSS